jgi:type IV secretory pathway TrbL component
VTAWLVVVFYFAMGVIVFITLLEFYLGTAITVILLPWGMFSKTAWLTEKALAYVFASGVRLLVLATILGTALPFLYGNAQSLGTGFDAVWRQLLGAGALLGLCWKANSIAQGFVYGGPALVLADAGLVIQHLNIQVTRLGNAIQGLADLMSRSDPNHPARQAAASRRRV